jgi:hypothetical protein
VKFVSKIVASLAPKQWSGEQSPQRLGFGGAPKHSFTTEDNEEKKGSPVDRDQTIVSLRCLCFLPFLSSASDP